MVKFGKKIFQKQKKIFKGKKKLLDNRPSHFPTGRKTWEHLMSGVVYTDDIYEGGSPLNLRNGGSGGTSPSPVGRFPARLEALDMPSPQPQAKKANIKKSR